MSKKCCKLLLAILCLAGSALAFFAVNLLMSDLANMYYTELNSDILSSLPAFVLALDFVLATLFVARLYRRPEQKRALMNLYTVLLAVFSLVGMVFSTLSGVVVYGNMFAPYPIFGYSAGCLVLHGLLLVGAVACNIAARKLLPCDAGRCQVKLKYVVYTAMLSLLILFAYNRFGALLFALGYVHARTLWLTWPFYVWLLVPLALLVYTTGSFFGWYAGPRRAAVVVPVVLLVVNAACGGAVFYLGTRYTQFISAISPALGLERLSSMPVDTLLQFGVVGLLCLYFALSAALRNRKSRRQMSIKE